MAVAHSAASESHAATTGSVSQTAFSWTHTQTGTPQGVLVFVHVANSTGNPVSSVTYGSVTLTRVTGGAAIDSAGEAGRTDLFFAGSGLGTGNQTITVNRANTVDVMYASAATVTALTNTNVTGIVLLQGDGALTVQSVTDGGAPTNSLRYAAAYSGLAAPPPAGTGSTLLNSIDFGNYGIALVRETTAGTGARNVGFNNATTDDRAAVHVAVRELWNRTDTETVGAFTLTGNNATLTKTSPKVMDGGTGAFTLTGQPADLRHNPDIEAGVGAFALAGQPADARHNVRIEGGTGAFSLVGNDATLSKSAAPKILAPEAGTFTLAGSAPALSVGHHLAGATGSFTLTGNPAGLTDTDRIAADTGAFTLTGNPATARRGYALAAETGTFTTTGQPAALRHNPRIEANTGSFALSGGAPSLLRGWYLSGGSGTFTETGQPATFRRTWVAQAATGAFALTGNPASLTELGAYEIDPIVGAFAITGQPAGLAQSQTMPVATGSFSLTGQPGMLRRTAALTPEVGQFASTSEPVGLIRARRLTPENGAFNSTSGEPNLLRGLRLAPTTGNISFAGISAELSAQSLKELLATAGAFALTGPNTSLSVGLRITPAAGNLALSGSAADLIVGGGPRLNAENGAFTFSANPAQTKAGKVLQTVAAIYSLTGNNVNFTDADVLFASVASYQILPGNTSLLKKRRRNIFIF